MPDTTATRHKLVAALERECTQQDRLCAHLRLPGEDGALVIVSWAGGRELSLSAALPPDREPAERLEALGWDRLDEQTMTQELSATHHLPRDAADVVDRLLAALTEGFGVEVIGSTWLFEPLPPTIGEQLSGFLRRLGFGRGR